MDMRNVLTGSAGGSPAMSASARKMLFFVPLLSQGGTRPYVGSPFLFNNLSRCPALSHPWDSFLLKSENLPIIIDII
jgi:hypothetical protein